MLNYNMTKIFEKYQSIVSCNDKTSIFHPGPFNLTVNSDRIYLDELFNPKKENFAELVSHILGIFEDYLQNDYLVGIIDHSEVQIDDLSSKSKELIDSCGIVLRNNYCIDVYYEPEEEWYTTIRMQPDTKDNLRKYVESILRGHVGLEGTYINNSVVFISSDGKILLNLYDDRGLDIVRLNVKEN